MTTFLNPHRLAAGGITGFFDQISMLREFWAEDPDWTPPAADADLTTLRDNGSLGLDLTAGGSIKPKYRTSTINSKPGYDFLATSSSVGGYAVNGSGASGSDITIVIVGRVDNQAQFPYLCDSSDASTRRGIIGAGSSSTWRCWHSTSLNAQGGTIDSSPHLFVARMTTSDLELWVDGTSTATDTSGTMASISGFTLGADHAQDSEMLNGPICYAAVYAGDLTAHADYDDYIAEINSHYGL